MPAPLDVVAILVAAGSGQRMGGVEKAFLPIGGIPLLCYSLSVLQASPLIQAVAVVVQGSSVERARSLVQERGFFKVAAVCPGGATRRDSVWAGLEAAPPSAWVLVHDAARPCLTEELIQRGLTAASGTGAAVAAVPVEDTIKEVGPGGAVQSTLDRSRLYAVQTPQVFAREVLRRAHQESPPGPSWDDAALLEALGWPVCVYPGDRTNVKVTAPEDLELVEALLSRRKGS